MIVPVLRKLFAFIFFSSFLSLLQAQTLVTLSTPGSGTWTVPCDVTTITVEVWGGGGGGQGVKGNGSSATGGGGAGGGYVKGTFTVTPGTAYNFSVGKGGDGTESTANNGESSWFKDSGTLLSVGGVGAIAFASNTAGQGVTSLKNGNVNVGASPLSTYGGNGGHSSVGNYSGGGGSSAGDISGNNASLSNGGAAPPNGYSGANGLTGNVVGQDGGKGAGGSGAKKGTGNAVNKGGKGGDGQIIITYTISLPGTPTASSTTSNSTILTWTGPGTYLIEYGPSGYLPGTGAVAGAGGTIATSSATSPYTLTGLAAGTAYDVFVRRINCPTPGAFGANSMKANFTTTIFPCAGSPIGGTAALNSSTGLPTSSFNATVLGDAIATGLSYQWQVANSTGGPWTDISGATNADATLTAISTPGITYYRRKITCANSGSSSFSTAESYTTQYCSSGITSGKESTNYIKMVKFIGTMHDTSQSSAFSSAPAGYQDFTGNTDKSIQAQGNGVNVYVENHDRGKVRAWVDWDRNGIFDDSLPERVYTSAGTTIISTTFGFEIPPAIPPGNYVIRIRMNTAPNTINIGPCGNIDYAGETEDYSFTVVENCSATITSISNQIRTGPGPITLEATPSPTSTKVRWYSDLTGGSPLAETDVVSGKSSWTPTVSSTTVYYVAAWNGTCESLVRIPVRAVVRPVPVITFTPDTPTSCGSTSTVKISASGQNETNYIIEEYFENGLGQFTQEILNSNGSTTDSKTKWQIRASTFTPNEKVWFPAIASGTIGNKFVMATSDVGTFTVDNVLVSPEKSTVGYSSLTLSFRMYYSKYSNDDVPDPEDYVAVEVNTDGGTTWKEVEKFTKDVGYGTQFALRTIDMSLYTSPNFRFRFRYYGKYKDGVAIDDIEFYGVKPLTTTFAWTSSAPINVYTDAAATIPYTAGSEVTTVYMNPSLDQKENTASWTINATASLSNGTTASGTVIIENKNKVWNVPGQNWNSSTWKPIGLVPTINDCVYIRTPVMIPTDITGFAKEIYILSGGKLTISKDSALKVQNNFTNNAAATDVVVESDGSLVQVNEGNTINTGSITAQRTINLSDGRQQYNYIHSPVEGQNLKTIYKGIDYVLYHNEANNFFYSSSGAYIKGRALAVKEPNKTGVPGTPATVTATFTGYPTNGAFTYGLVNSNTGNMAKRGFNLVGNPYPSNMDLIEFYKINGAAAGNISATFHLWDNRANSQTVQMGDAYGQQAYAIFNAVDNTGTLATGDAGLPGNNRPTQYIKMGQGFMIQSKVASQQVKFNNTIRTTDKGTVSFFGKGEQATESLMDRYWLNMITPGNLAAQIAVVYFEGGNNAFSDDDSYSMGGSDALYSVVEGEKVSINGRSSFKDSDVVPLGTAHFTGGNYTLTIQDKEGIFASGQSIYLKDKQTGVLTDLSQGNYTFAANAGESAGRFEIVYKPEMVLATDGAVKEEIQVYRDGNHFVVKSLSKKISSLEVYDASGKLISTLQPNSIKAVIDAASLANGMYLIKIHQNGEVTSRKVLK
ncbi:T9SS type A sorting domain-containing protein [Kaistella sp. DKR-2]|uniref:GEVED domain-containing protein n=1 Tax=Kaistella soli TaxID=2849654 RepID=UPI001C25DD90|nr:GEVED domain-containing protein [Kaistella soli]MBU8882735.1 T9SS type A sorting domain-containing protein [Kaistella soli]